MIAITEKDRIFHLPFLLKLTGSVVGYTEDLQKVLHGLIYLGVLETVEVDLGDFL